MRALEEVVASGRARFVGVSNFTGAMLAECMQTRRVDVSQVGYHMLDRRQEEATFPYCLREGIGVMGYGSLGHGLLTGAFTAATTFDTARDWRGNGVAFGQPIFRGDNFRTNVGVVERIRREVAEPRGVSVSQIALAWALGQSRDQHRAGGRAHPGGSGRQRRRRRARSLGGRAQDHRRRSSPEWRGACASSPRSSRRCSRGARRFPRGVSPSAGSPEQKARAQIDAALGRRAGSSRTATT